MGVTLQEAQNTLDEAVKVLYQSDPRVRSVGIGRHDDSYGFHVIRNAAQVLPLGEVSGPPPLAIHNVPVTFQDRHTDVEPHVKLPFTGPGSPSVASLVPEQRRHNPLVCGLQIENFDDDIRTATIAGGHFVIGTLGCFVILSNGDTALLSNNHVVAGENRGVRGTDRITHPGSGTFLAADHVATLTDYVNIVSSASGVTPATGTVNFNDIDAGVATLQPNVIHHQRYLPSRHVPAPSGTVPPAVHDHVFKIGRTTGLTHGIITSITAVVGPIPYASGPTWFRRAITIEGVNGTMFSDHGDSGSIVIKESTGEVIGLLYAGNGVDTFVCPINAVLTALRCRIA